jgi:hypothetical protein
LLPGGAAEHRVLNKSPYAYVKDFKRHAAWLLVLTRLDAQIGSLDNGDGEFIVVIPFTGGSQQCSSTPMQSQEQIVNPSKAPEVSAATDSTWKNIMDDLSSIPTSP